MQNLNNYYKRILSLERKDFKPLLDLVPEIRKDENYGELLTGEKDKNDVYIMPYS